MTDRREELRRRALKERERLMARVDRLLNHGEKHLEGERRLRAAQFIRSRYKALIRPSGTLRVTDLEQQLGERGDRLQGIRIHRWMLRASDGDVTPDLVREYDGRPEPLKKTRTYFALAAALAAIGDADPGDAQIDLLRAIGLDGAGGDDLDPTDPEQFDPARGLLLLLRDFASNAADQLDLGGMFERTERLQAGWDPQHGATAKTLEDPFQICMASTIFGGSWLMTGLPPIPCAPVADIILGRLESASFVVTFGDGRSRCRTGAVTSWWRLHLGIAPRPGHGVTPCLVRTVRLTVDFDDDEDGEFDAPTEILHSGDGLLDLHPGMGRQPVLKQDPDISLCLTAESAEKFDRLEEAERLYFRARPDEILPHEGLPLAEIEPLDASRLIFWLRDCGRRVDDEVQPLLHTAPSLSETVHAGALWFSSPCLARDVEQALRSGVLVGAIRRWVRSYEKSLDGLESQRTAEMVRADEALRARWAAERLGADRDNDTQ